MNRHHTSGSPLGRRTAYSGAYSPALLCPIERENSWRQRGYKQAPYQGVDLWNAYELSWLNDKGMPQVALGKFIVPCTSPRLIESKSFKLYLNSFAQTPFASAAAVCALMQADLSACTGMDIELELAAIDEPLFSFGNFAGVCLDGLDISTSYYSPNAEFLRHRSERLVEERLFTHLLRSLCPVTGQPDWGSVYIEYAGAEIEHEGLLKYLISYREQRDFHEHCVERIYLDILERCKPDALTVYARYVRRGGLDINPFRTNTAKTPANIRLVRQ